MAARPLVERQPNEQLQAVVNEAGCSNVGLARRVNMYGTERGLDLRYDKTSVSRWLRGQQPRGLTPVIIAEVLGHKLGRAVSVEEIGMANSRQQEASGVGLTFAPALPNALEQASDLWRSDAKGRNLHSGSVVAVSALLGPSRDWLITDPDSSVSRAGGQQVGVADIELMKQTTRHLADLDHRFGSGHVRPIAVHYLNSVVSDLLKGSYREAAGRQLCAAAARLTELVGYMAVDSGKAGLAQRYYIQALRLAQAAGDRGYGGYVLAAGMSHLAASLGYPREVAQLARVAQEGTRGQATLTTQACLYAAEARGYARLGDAQACSLAAGRAVDALERADPDDDPEWISHFDRAYLADELAHCYVDLQQPKPAARKAEEALTGHPEHRVRRRAIGFFLLAIAQIQAREVDEACTTATQAVKLIPHLRSNLSVEYLKNFRSQLRPFEREVAVHEFMARLEKSNVTDRLVISHADDQ
jgi:tetratricopeptide (TPR) repeat protein